MFHLTDQSLALAATDLSNHLACSRLTQERLAVARKEREKPHVVKDPHVALIQDRGDEHEAEQLELLSAECGGHVDLKAEPLYTRDGLTAAHTRAVGAMEAGEPLIYQPTLFDGAWLGRLDFLRRIEVPSCLGSYSYEVLDTKLARSANPKFVHQLALYSSLVARVQDLDPEKAHIILGDGSRVELVLADYLALHRHVVRTLAGIAGSPKADHYPEPVAHCSICDFYRECTKRLRADDHLSFVAGAHRRRRELLDDLGIHTLEGLATSPTDLEVRALGTEQFLHLRSQAALQLETRETEQPTRSYLKPEREIGYALLPEPSEGDIFFDLEGDPYIGEEGIEYLWGWWTRDGGYKCMWAHTAADEKAALEQFVDLVVAVRAEHPGTHVYHYAHHERSKLANLALKYATREEEVDDLLRSAALVDLLAVVRQGMQVGEESYSLKKLEWHHGFEREELSVRAGGGSIVAYENWLQLRDDELLVPIRDYNEEDCRSTASLRDWLWGTTLPEAEKQFDVEFAQLREAEPEEPREPPQWLAAVTALAARLRDGLDPDPADDSPDEAERRLMAHSLFFHHREQKPEWWQYYALRSLSADELIWEREAVSGIVRDESAPPEPVKRSLVYTYRFPPQEFKLDLGSVEDPVLGGGYTLIALEEDHLKLSRNAGAPPPEPTALAGRGPFGVTNLREALVELGESVAVGSESFPASRALLRREAPRLTGGALTEDVDDLSAAAIGLDRSILPIQGPPGTGKTYRGARMILAALAAGRRVAITAPSHAAIKNMLAEIEKTAAESGQEFTGVYKGYEYQSPTGQIELVDENADAEGDFDLVAGTAWLFARPAHRQRFELLFVDEASQYSLANALAASLCAESVVLLGDPQQLPQVTQATHPDGSGAAVLEHLLDGADTIDPAKGVLLPTSWRMHPDVTSFVSEHSYDGKLSCHEGCTNRNVTALEGALTGTGLRTIAVEHAGRSQYSPEEAEAIAGACADLLNGGTVTRFDGATESLRPEDILVVAPYNMAVREILKRVPAGVRVGTVDRFQGQEAPIVFYALTCSSGDDVPRGLDFLFDKNRLNVAVSRAQCLSVLAYSPRLIDADCQTLRAMRLLNGVCRYLEAAEQAATSATP